MLLILVLAPSEYYAKLRSTILWSSLRGSLTYKATLATADKEHKALIVHEVHNATAISEPSPRGKATICQAEVLPQSSALGAEVTLYTWTPTVCNRIAFWAVLEKFGLTYFWGPGTDKSSSRLDSELRF